MAGGSTDAATKEMEALHVGQTQETKVSTIKPANLYLCPELNLGSLYLCWYMEKLLGMNKSHSSCKPILLCFLELVFSYS